MCVCAYVRALLKYKERKESRGGFKTKIALLEVKEDLLRVGRGVCLVVVVGREASFQVVLDSIKERAHLHHSLSLCAEIASI